ncbi:MAG: hypothetical protein WCI84_06510 [Bacteroidota bacterium]
MGHKIQDDGGFLGIGGGEGHGFGLGADTLAEYCKFVEFGGEKDPDTITDQSIDNIAQALTRSYEILSSTISKLGIA